MFSGRETVKLKIVLLGDSGVGKTAWLRRIKGGRFRRPSVSDKFGGAMDFVNIEFVDGAYSFACFELSGQERFKTVVDAYISSPQVTDAYVVFYNDKIRKSFDNVDHYVDRIRKLTSSPGVKILLVGTHFEGGADVTEEEAESKARKLGLYSRYGVDAKLGSDNEVLWPFHFVIRQSDKAQITIPLPDILPCYQVIEDALDYCWHAERKQKLSNLKQSLDGFSGYCADMTVKQLDELKLKCQDVCDQAQAIYDDAYPERVKAAVFGAAAVVLIITSLFCGLALLNVFAVPVFAVAVLLGVVCATSGVGGLFSGGFGIYKVLESNKYAAIVDEAKAIDAPYREISYNKLI
jgi:hypothetical protein